MLQNNMCQPKSELFVLPCIDLQEVGGRGQRKQVALKATQCWASLVAQWLRVCLPMQGTRVRALVWEDPTCRGAAGPVSHNC